KFWTLNSWFWWENIWMPINCTWADFVDRDGLVFPKPQQLYVTIPYAFVLLIIRFFTERYVAIPLAKALGIKNVRRVKPQPNPVLESYFRECSRHPSQSEIQGLAKKCNCTVHLVEKWFRRRRNLEIPTVLRKFQEAFELISGNTCNMFVLYSIQAAKMFNYARWEKTCNMLFFIFSIAFFITRIILFPFWILRATLYQPTFYSTTPVIAYFLFNGQLLILQGLHLYWGYLIFKILKRFIFLKVSNFASQKDVKYQIPSIDLLGISYCLPEFPCQRSC
uniref:Ceramide synthase 3 n=1 Tax=Meleagris gallopavo TaxID=9103 RepID=A0A803Y0A0_MELGA